MSAILEDAGLFFRLTRRDMPAVLTHPLQPCPHRLQCCNCCHIFSKGVTTEFLASMISGPAELYPESLSQNYTCSGCRAHRCTTRLWYLCGDHVAHAYVLPASIALHGRDYDKEQKRVSRGDATCVCTCRNRRRSRMKTRQQCWKGCAQHNVLLQESREYGKGRAQRRARK